MKIKFLALIMLLACSSSAFAQIEEVKEEVQIRIPPLPPPPPILPDSIRKKRELEDLEYCKQRRFRDDSCEGKSKAERYRCSQKKMLEFIYKNIKYPQEARDNGIDGTVVISFTVSYSGRVKNAQIVRDIGFGCGEEALRVVNMMPDWSPGDARGGGPDDCFHNLPIKFRLE